MTSEKVLEYYIKDLEQELAGLSVGERQEILTEIRTHLVEKWKQQGDETSAGMLNVIEEFGDARGIAREYTGGGSVQKSSDSLPSWLVVALTVFLWPVGIVLAWLSSQWRTKNKLIATLILPVLLVTLIVFNLAAYSVDTGRVTEFSHEYSQGGAEFEMVEQRGPARWVTTLASVINILVLISLIGSPVITGVYLAVTKIG